MHLEFHILLRSSRFLTMCRSAAARRGLCGARAGQERGECRGPAGWGSGSVGGDTADTPLFYGQPEPSSQGTRTLPSPSCWGPETCCKNCHAKRWGCCGPACCCCLGLLHYFLCLLFFFSGWGKIILKCFKSLIQSLENFFLIFAHRARLGILVSTPLPWLWEGLVLFFSARKNRRFLVCCRLVAGTQPPHHGGTGHPACRRRFHRNCQCVFQRGRPEQVGAI